MKVELYRKYAQSFLGKWQDTVPLKLTYRVSVTLVEISCQPKDVIPLLKKYGYQPATYEEVLNLMAQYRHKIYSNYSSKRESFNYVACFGTLRDSSLYPVFTFNETGHGDPADFMIAHGNVNSWNHSGSLLVAVVKQ